MLLRGLLQQGHSQGGMHTTAHSHVVTHLIHNLGVTQAGFSLSDFTLSFC